MGLDVGSEGCALDQHVDSAPATLEGECLTIATDCLDSMHLQKALHDNTQCC